MAVQMMFYQHKIMPGWILGVLIDFPCFPSFNSIFRISDKLLNNLSSIFVELLKYISVQLNYIIPQSRVIYIPLCFL